MKKVLFVLVIVLVLSSLVQISSQIINDVEDNEGGDSMAKYDYKDISKDQMNTWDDLDNYVNNMKSTNKDLIGANVEFNDITESIELKGSDGQTLLEIPKGVNLKFENGELSFSGEPVPVQAIQDNEPFTKDITRGIVDTQKPPTEQVRKINIMGTKIYMAGFDKVNVKPTLEGTEIYTEGSGVIEINGNRFVGIENARFIYDKDKNLVFAELQSVDGGDYNINIGDKSYNFKILKGDKLVIDLKNKKVEVKKQGQDNERRTYTFTENEKSFSFDTSSSSTLILDDKGQPYQLILEKGATLFYHDGVFWSNEGGINVFFDGRELTESDGRSISFDIGTDRFNIRGMVEIFGLDGNLDYSGYSENTYTKFGIEEGKYHFDLLEGNARFSNRIVEILHQNGETKFKKLKTKYDYFSDFSFTTRDSSGIALNGEVSEIGGNINFKFDGFNRHGELMTISKPLEELSQGYSLQLELNRGLQVKGEVAKLASVVEDINTKIATEKDPLKKEELIFERIQSEKLLLQLSEMDTSGSVEELNSFINSFTNPETRARAITTLISWKADESDRINIPRLYSMRTAEVVADYAILDGFGLEVVRDKNGNDFVRNFIRDSDGKRYSININTDVIIDELKIYEDSLKKVVRDVKASKGYINLKKYSYDYGDENGYFSQTAFAISDRGIDRESSVYKNAIEINQDLNARLTEAKKYASENNDDEMLSLLKINEAKLLRFEDSEKAKKLLYEVDQSSENDVLRAEAKRIRASMYFSENPRENAEDTLRLLRNAINIDPNNIRARNQLNLVIDSLLSDRISQRFAEPEKHFNDLMSRFKYGFRPFSYAAMRLTNFDETRVEDFAQLTEKNNYALVGTNAMRSLIRSGISMDDYFQASTNDKLMQIMQANGIDRYVRIPEFQQYLESGQLDFEGVDKFSNSLSKLGAKIEAHRGADIRKKFMTDFNKAVYLMGAIEDVSKTDPAVNIIANNGAASENILFEGNHDRLANAFTSDNLNKPIRTTFTEVGLNIADFGALTVALSGAGKALMYLAESAKIGRAVSILQAMMNPTEAWLIKSAGASRFTSLAGFVGDTVAQTIAIDALNTISSGAGTTFDVLTNVLGGINPEKQLINLVEDAAGKTKLFIKASSRAEADKLAKKFRGLADEVIVGLHIPKGYKDRGAFFLEDLVNANAEKHRLAEQIFSSNTRISTARGGVDLSTFNSRDIDYSDISKQRKSELFSLSTRKGNLNPVDLEGLSDNERLYLYESKLRNMGLLQKELTDEQKKAVLAAHYSEIGATRSDVLQLKYNIARDSGLTKEQIQVGMDNWIMGGKEHLSLNDRFKDEIDSFRKASKNKRRLYSSAEINDLGLSQADRTFRKKLINLLEMPSKKDVKTDKIAYLLPQFRAVQYTGKKLTVPSGRKFKVYRGTPTSGGGDVFFIVDRTEAHMHSVKMGNQDIVLPHHIDIQRWQGKRWVHVREDAIDWIGMIRSSHSYDILNHYAQ